MNIQPGTLLAGKYRTVRCLGVGGMGEVWAARRVSDGLDVAIKLLLTGSSNNGEIIARFKREAHVLFRIQSPYVAQVLDFLEDPDFGLLLVMELIPGQSLHALLVDQGRLSIEATLDIAVDVVRGLRDLHACNIVHRDLKPGNIVLRPIPARRPRATLIDFGVSRIISNPDEEEVTAITRGDRVLGTLEYMAPEQILGSRSVTGTADLYAVGAMLYRTIAGVHAYGDLTEGQLAVAKLNQDAPPVPTGRSDPLAVQTQALIAKLLARRIRERFNTADEVLLELERLRSLSREMSRLARSDAWVDELTAEDLQEADEPSVSVSTAEVFASAADEARPTGAPSSSSTGPLRPTPMDASYSPGPGPQASSWRAPLVTAALVLLGVVAGSAIGASYARGGLAYQMLSSMHAAGTGQAPPQPLPSAPVAVPTSSASASATPPKAEPPAVPH